MDKEHQPKGRTNNLVTMSIDGETLIYDLTGNKAYCLNETSATIWEACSGNNSVAEISNILSRRLKIPIGEDLIWLALIELSKNNLLERSESAFPKIDRRDVIRKIGLASMASLPVIASIVAPNAVMAGSCTPDLVAPGGMVGPTTYPDLNVSNDSSGDICLQRLTAQCCSMIAGGSCSCSVVSCIGSVTCS